MGIPGLLRVRRRGLIFPQTGFGGRWVELDHDSWLLNAYGMKGYNYADKTIDGIIFVDYIDIDRITMIKQKWNELTDPQTFYTWIDDIRKTRYVTISRDESDQLLEKYENGCLTDEMIYELYY